MDPETGSSLVELSFLLFALPPTQNIGYFHMEALHRGHFSLPCAVEGVVEGAVGGRASECQGQLHWRSGLSGEVTVDPERP